MTAPLTMDPTLWRPPRYGALTGFPGFGSMQQPNIGANPSPGVTPTAPPFQPYVQNPATPGAVGNPSVTPGTGPNIGSPPPGTQYGPITPSQNIIGTSVLPKQSPGAATAQQDVLGNLNTVQNAPDRNALAQQTFGELSAQTEPDYQAALRAATQAGAAGGQLGSGMLTERLTSDPFGSSGLGLQRQKYLGNLAAELSTQSAGQTLQDRLSQLQAGQGVLGQLSGLDQQGYQDVLGERSYETGLSQQAYDNALAAAGLSQPNPLAANIANTYSGQAQGAYGNAGDLLRLLFQNQQPTVNQ
jgi:hypothetical protein